MNINEKEFMILMADDDPDDRFLMKEAFEEARFPNELCFVEDGEELMDYLCHRGKYSSPNTAPRPNLILLDLNMPKKSGYEALSEIKAEPDLRRIPIVILTTSQAEEDIFRTYDLGANSYITKPLSFESLVEIVSTLRKYWFEIVEPMNYCHLDTLLVTWSQRFGK